MKRPEGRAPDPMGRELIASEDLRMLPGFNPMNEHASRRGPPVLATILVVVVFLNLKTSQSADTYIPFAGEKSEWHDGFDRYDYLMDEATFAITPFKRPEGEKFAVGSPPKGQRRCIVVVPRKVAAGSPWS